MKAMVTEVGAHALDGKEAMLILFGEGATESLREYSVIQAFEDKTKITVKKGDRVKIDDAVYTVEQVGSFANANLNSIAHVTLVFAPVPDEDPVVNGLYLSPTIYPTLQVGSTIEYLLEGE